MIITNFSSGMLSPTLQGRTDLQPYFQGAGNLKNFDVIPTGGIKRRSGAKLCGELNGPCRLIPMIIDSSTSFIFEVYPNEGEGSTMAVWINGEKMLGTDGLQIKIQSPWNSLEEINAVQYAQNYATMIFTEWNHIPFQLIYKEGSKTFEYGSMTFDFTPDLQLDDDFDYIKVWDGSAIPATNIFEGKEYYALIFKSDLYYWDNEDESWKKDTSTTEYKMDEGLFTEENKRPACVTFFASRLFFSCTKNDPQKVWASAAPDIDGTKYNEFHTYVKYITVNKIIKNPDVHFFTGNLTKNSNTITQITQNLTQIENLEKYYISSDMLPVGTKAVSATWNEETNKGTLTVNQLAVQDAEAQVMSIQTWQYRSAASADDYEYKVVNQNMTAQDNGFYFEVAGDENDRIKWLAPSKQLIIGTESSCYAVPAGVTALSVQASLDGRYGTDSIQAKVVDTAVLFFSQGLKKLREYYYSNQSEAFVTQDLAVLVPEIISDSAAKTFDYMTNPNNRIVVTREDGKQAVLLYEKTEGVRAWGLYEYGCGTVESCATTRGESGSDILYIACRKEIPDEDDKWTLCAINYEEKVYLDAWKEYEVGDEELYTNEAVITEDGYIGYPYESSITSMPVVDDGTGSKKRITKLLVRFYNSIKPELKVSGRENEKFTSFIEPFTGLKEIDYPGDSARDVTFTLTTTGLKDCIILAVNASLA